MNKTTSKVKAKAETTAQPPEWFAVTRWNTEDIIAIAAKRGIAMTEEAAVAWWRKNEKAFEDAMTETGNEILDGMFSLTNAQ